jgi:Ankyrin repeat
MRLAMTAVIAATLWSGCNSRPEALPVPPPKSTTPIDNDFPSDGDDPRPLDIAVTTEAPAQVRTLLDGGADPNSRWSSHGDRFPLQEAIELGPSYGISQRYRAEIVRLLLEHGADPNARWCPFESRGHDLEKYGLHGCTSDGGVTPLIEAVMRDQADSVQLLLAAGADPTLEDISGANAFDYGRSQAVFLLLQAHMFPDSPSRNAATLNHLRRRADTPRSKAPWEETPLARAAAGVYAQGAASGILIEPPKAWWPSAGLHARG